MVGTCKESGRTRDIDRAIAVQRKRRMRRRELTGAMTSDLGAESTVTGSASSRKFESREQRQKQKKGTRSFRFKIMEEQEKNILEESDGQKGERRNGRHPHPTVSR